MTILILSLLLVAVLTQDTSELGFETAFIGGEQNCYCAGGSIPVWNYETVPLAQTGAGCIGGCGGYPFADHDTSGQLNTISNL